MSKNEATCDANQSIPADLYAPNSGVILRGLFKGLNLTRFAAKANQEQCEMFLHFLCRLDQGRTGPAYIRLELSQELVELLIECGASRI